ncbi:hypothetical protein J7T55_002801 [Diaporthe amygdali]|uniref:uncharacterized protein n=1 Tax=Phomopsis amygdali TaxID=1214568 RepID=UPI0022FE3F7D|nr:uncharacterized protein J7T55_002801 [Diaporthe amygdali]KAJ0122288.1 hypothetical protein J7T55_002801 [Diaporthe amygdali]
MTSHVSTPASANYEELRRRGFNDRIPDAKPAEIVSPNTTADVVEAVQRARQCGRKIGVRSGGHHFFHPDLVENGMLIDTRNLNKSMEFDPATKIATISPGHTVEDLAGFLGPLQRFFPSGHSRSVGVGGFLLAGGQGLFIRGWGYTSTNWVEKIELVTSEGEIVIASKTENPDLFWAMPGSGQGFFAVITRIWIKTIPNKRLVDVTTIVDSTDIFKPLLKWVLTTVKSIPKYGAEPFFCTFYADKDDPEGGEESKSKRVFFVINQTMFADSLEEAKVLASPWATIPDEFKRHVITTVPLTERDREGLWELQENFQPSGNGERWNVDSILANPELIEAITPALYDLPSRLSTGTLCPLDYYPDESDQALSLPQKSYISSMLCWKDPGRDVFMDKWLRNAYEKAGAVSCGVYAADFNANNRMTKVMTDSALKKWLRIREKWDPSEAFIGYRGFASALDLPA